ncbi:hypothetical protein GGS26DRAFT_534961 [Hypomontagnella submonticulosa]|nr:hypothetical protein GGS26DRAFT_534961 [Hypomontagnella submonticulosa]
MFESNIRSLLSSDLLQRSPLHNSHYTEPKSESSPVDSHILPGSLSTKSVVGCNLVPKLSESRRNRVYEWLSHIQRSQSPEQPPSEPDLSSASSLDSVDILPSYHDSTSTTNVASSSTASEEYRTVNLRGAGVWYYPELPTKLQVIPDHVQAHINRMLADPGIDFPESDWQHHFEEFRKKQGSSPSINESTGTTALFEQILRDDKKTKSASSMSWARENQLTNLYNPKSLPLTTPAPDVTFGFTTTALTEFFMKQPALDIRMKCRVGRNTQLYFPYFAAELKAPNKDTISGLHQCMNNGSMGAGILRNLMGYQTPEQRGRIIMFSALLNLYTVTFYVTWVTDVAKRRFIVMEVDSFLLETVQEFIRCRKIIYNIHMWALRDHIPMLKAQLNALEPYRPSDRPTTQEDITARGAAAPGTAAGWMATAEIA